MDADLQRIPAPLETLPTEILITIADLVPPRSLVAFACITRRLHTVFTRLLIEHKELHDSLWTDQGKPRLGPEQLLIAILEKPLLTRHILRWRASILDHEDHVELTSGTLLLEVFGIRKALSAIERDQRYATMVKLVNLIGSAPLEELRETALRIIELNPPRAWFHGLGLCLCDDVEELVIAKGAVLTDLLSFFPPNSLARYLPSLASFETQVPDWDVEQTPLGIIQPLLVLPKLETIKLKGMYASRDDDVRFDISAIACRLSDIRLESCLIQPEPLARFLSTVVKNECNGTSPGASLGLRSLTFSFGLGNSTSSEACHAFQASQIISAIRDSVGQSLQSLNLSCMSDVWAECLAEDDSVSSNWDMTRLSNLRDGFHRLNEVVLGPELLVCGWLCPSTGGSDMSERFNPNVNSLPLAALLPRTLRVLKLSQFNTRKYEVAAPLALGKLVTHLQNDLDATPELCEVHLMETRDVEDMTLNTPEFELELEQFARLCEMRKIKLELGHTLPPQKQWDGPMLDTLEVTLDSYAFLPSIN